MLVEPLRIAQLEYCRGEYSTFIDMNYSEAWRFPVNMYKETIFPVWVNKHDKLPLFKARATFIHAWGLFRQQSGLSLTHTTHPRPGELYFKKELLAPNFRHKEHTYTGYVFEPASEMTDLFTGEYRLTPVKRFLAKPCNPDTYGVYIGHDKKVQGKQFTLYYDSTNSVCDSCAYLYSDGTCLAWYSDMRSSFFRQLYNSWFWLSCLTYRMCPLYTQGGDSRVPDIYRQWKLGTHRVPSRKQSVQTADATVGSLIQRDLQALQLDGDALPRPVLPTVQVRHKPSSPRRGSKTRTTPARRGRSKSK